MSAAPDAYACAECLGPLEVSYDHTLTGEALRDAIRSGPTSLWRYAPLLPVATVPDDPVGWTPLVRADRLGRELGLDELWLKNDTVTPIPSVSAKPFTVPVPK